MAQPVIAFENNIMYNQGGSILGVADDTVAEEKKKVLTEEQGEVEVMSDDSNEHPVHLKEFDEISEPDTVYRNQRKRYPWWVRNVDEPTIAIDRTRTRRMNFRKTTLTLASRFFTPQNLEEMVEKYSKSGISQYIGRRRKNARAASKKMEIR
jgi:hypothetical protein